MTTTLHPLDWSKGDVEMWCLTEGLTACAASLLGGFEGRALWNLDKEKLYSKESDFRNLCTTAEANDARTAPSRDTVVVCDVFPALSGHDGGVKVQGTVGVGMALRACDSGLEITEIIPNGPVHRAGQVRVGDILKKVDGKVVGETVELLIGPEGTTVTLNVLRHAPFGMFGMPDSISVSVV